MRVLVLADIHANLTAFETVLAAADGWDACWNLGDCVGYGPDPGECIAKIREIGAVSVSGNHDLAACGSALADSFNPLAAEAVAITQSRLNSAEIEFLKALPEKLIPNDNFTLAHGSPRLPAWEYLHHAEAARDNFAHFKTSLCLVGHTHRPTIFELRDDECVQSNWQDGETIDLTGKRLILNPGSVGQPRDADPRAAYAIYNDAARTITLHRMAYDVSAVQQRMIELALPETLIRRLEFGF